MQRNPQPETTPCHSYGIQLAETSIFSLAHKPNPRSCYFIGIFSVTLRWNYISGSEHKLAPMCWQCSISQGWECIKILLTVQKHFVCSGSRAKQLQTLPGWILNAPPVYKAIQKSSGLFSLQSHCNPIVQLPLHEYIHTDSVLSAQWCRLPARGWARSAVW